MTLEQITLNWPRPKELINKARGGDDLTSGELLSLKSASFHAPIRMLSLAQGPTESPKELYIQIAYNILRELDEAEDAGSVLMKDEKIWVLNALPNIIDDVVHKDPNGSNDGIEGIIKGNNFRTITEKLKAGAVDEAASVFVEQFGKGTVLRDLYNIGKEGKIGRDIQEAIHYCVASMSDGMIEFLRQGPIETVYQLHNYCLKVAGAIGSRLLNKIIEYTDKDEQGRPILLDGSLAEQFGEGLQLTNIVKNVSNDYKEGRRFFPGEFIHKGLSYEKMMDDWITLDAKETRRKIFDRMLSLIESNFQSSIKYLQSIPTHLSGYRGFCLIPFITARKTIENMLEAGPEPAELIFSGDENAKKVPYGIDGIVDFSYGIVKHEGGKYLNEWLDTFGQNPRQFSFKPGEYEQWADPYRGNYRVTIVHS